MLIPRHIGSKYGNRVTVKQIARYMNGLGNNGTAKPHSRLAFAFDIDGVLLRGGTNPLPAAKEALSILDGNNKLGLYLCFTALTNGGGASEEERCRKLSSQLGVQIRPDQFIQAHTVLKSIVHNYVNVPVLVLGGKGDTLRKVAEGYGFQKVYTTLDILAWNPSIWPFHSLTEEERASVRPVDFSNIQFGAIFVFHDPRNWALDTQVMCDVIQGIIGGSHETNHTRKPVDLVFCNPDLIWQSDFKAPRMGQGAFRVAFQAVFQASLSFTAKSHREQPDAPFLQSLTGSTYPYIQLGKPTEATYNFAEMMLKHRLEGTWWAVRISHLFLHVTLNFIVTADNPESDIAGANAAGWKSILVHTGVYDPHRGPPSHQPTHQAEDVAEAVRWAIEQEFC
ncbi:HAD-like domain-containing protein [Suillus bovinus]|uniref:HAD-like domain-containing protein n=1 Tax=Suillus bovinus TaxID=48563 RepID=UPI001B8617D7|nr:HAD-like domain-containing protein [Suillus bovinus]KAG2128036.1 HAD-like domain-containing protein [Suillus bovinus]